MKCYICKKIPNKCITLHFSSHSDIVCDDCFDNINLCDNSINHEDDRIALNSYNNSFNYCDECFRQIKISDLNETLPIDLKKIFKDISKYI